MGCGQRPFFPALPLPIGGGRAEGGPMDVVRACVRLGQLMRGLHSANNALCCASQIVCVAWWGGWGGGSRREGASEAAPEAVRQAVGGGCQSGCGRLLPVTNAIEAGTWRQGDSGWA